MTRPRVSILMPTYNYAEVLPYSIGSVLSQTFTDFELLVTGDGCTDESERVVRQIEDPRVHWFNLPSNTGNASAPNNSGLERARGEIIAYIGHDDLWLPGHLGALVEAIESGFDFAYSMSALLDPGGECRVGPLKAFEGAPELSPSQIAHTRAIIDAAGPWTPLAELDTEQDVDVFNRMHAAGSRSRFVPHVSVIKPEAARRKNVYRDRPVFEQKAWTERIRDGLLLELIDIQETRVDELRRREIANMGLGQALTGVFRALTRVPRLKLRDWQRARRAEASKTHFYAADFDWSKLDDRERARRYRSLYEQRRAFKGLPPLGADRVPKGGGPT